MQLIAQEVLIQYFFFVSLEIKHTYDDKYACVLCNVTGTEISYHPFFWIPHWSNEIVKKEEVEVKPKEEQHYQQKIHQ